MDSLIRWYDATGRKPLDTADGEDFDIGPDDQLKLRPEAGFALAVCFGKTRITLGVSDPNLGCSAGRGRCKC